MLSDMDTRIQTKSLLVSSPCSFHSFRSPFLFGDFYSHGFLGNANVIEMTMVEISVFANISQWEFDASTRRCS